MPVDYDGNDDGGDDDVGGNVVVDWSQFDYCNYNLNHLNYDV